MGRFFQTSTPTFVDNKMFQLPFELMGKVLEKKDAAIQSDVDITLALADDLKAQGLKIDEPRLQEKIGQYQSRIDEAVQNIKGNVLNYDTTGIQKLKRDITTDWTTGEVGAIQKNRAGYLADLETWKELAKKEPEKYTQEYLDKLAAESLKGYGGVKYNSPTDYKSYQGLSATAMPDVNAWVEEKLKGALPDVTSVEREGNEGGWRVKRGTETKIMSEEDLNNILEGSLKADPSMQAALKQRRDFGMAGFENLFGENDELLNPVSFGTNEKGQRGMKYQDNILGHAFTAGLEKFGFSETKQTVDSKVDSFALQAQASALKRKEEADEFVTMTDTGTVTPFGGTTQIAFMTERNADAKRKAEIEGQALTIAMKEYGYNDVATFREKSPDIYKKVLAGDLIGAGITSETASNLTRESRLLKLKQNVRNNIVTEYRRLYPAPTSTDKKVIREDHEKFNTYLKDKGAVEVPITKGWGYLPDFNAKKQGQLIKQLKESNLLESALISIPKGTIVKDKDGKNVDLSKYGSINDMVDAGLVRVVQKKTGVVNEEPTFMIDPATGQPTTLQTGTTKVIETMNGTVLGNLDLSPSSVVPVFGASNDGKVQMEATLTIGGKAAKLIVNNMSSTSIDKFNEDNATILAGRKMIAQIGGGSADLSPNQDGSMIYHGEKKGQGRSGSYEEDKTYDKGWVEVIDPKTKKVQIYSITDPHVEKVIFKRIFQ